MIIHGTARLKLDTPRTPSCRLQSPGRVHLTSPEHLSPRLRVRMSKLVALVPGRTRSRDYLLQMRTTPSSLLPPPSSQLLPTVVLRLTWEPQLPASFRIFTYPFPLSTLAIHRCLYQARLTKELSFPKEDQTLLLDTPGSLWNHPVLTLAAARLTFRDRRHQSVCSLAVPGPGLP